MPLTIYAPRRMALRFIVRAALYSGRWIHLVIWAVPFTFVGTTSTASLVSQICSYCDFGAMERKPDRINASTVAVNVSRWRFSFAANSSRKTG
ncbi:hypothetical protein DMS95_11445 [Klebsiella variicola]|nr:hypothetical protein DMS95_11445 [Klebsiella variicola]